MALTNLGFPKGARPRVAYLMSGLGRTQRGAEALTLDLIGPLRHFVDLTVFGAAELGQQVRALPMVPRNARWLEQLTATLPASASRILRRLHLTPVGVEMLTFMLSAQPALWAGHYDAWLVATGSWGCLLASLYRRLTGTPFLVLGHGGYWGELDNARFHPDLHLFVNTDVRDAVVRKIPGLRSAVIPNGIDLTRFSPPSLLSGSSRPLPRCRILSVGALEPGKRLDLTLQAVALIPTASLVICGTGPEASRLQALGTRLLGPQRFSLTSADRSAMPELYRACDVFTLASTEETCGMVYLEALACGKPVVAPDDATRRFVVGGAGILLPDIANPARYVAALTRALQGPLALAPRVQAERFNIHRTAAQYAAAIHTVVGERG